MIDSDNKLQQLLILNFITPVLNFRNQIKEEAKGVNLLQHAKQNDYLPSNSTSKSSEKSQVSSVSEISAFPEEHQSSTINKRLIQNSEPNSSVQTKQFRFKNSHNYQGQNSNVSTPSSQTSRNPSNTVNVKGLPITSTVSKNGSTRLSEGGSNFGSPIPCGESFFEDDAVLTQTHVQFMSKFKRHSLPGSHDASSSSFINISSPVVGQFAESNKFNFNHSPGQVGSHQNRAIFVNQSDSFISPNTFKSANDVNNRNNNYDSIDDELDLQLAEQSNFDFEYKISSASHTANSKKSTDTFGKGSNFGVSSSQRGDDCGNGEEVGGYDFDDTNQSGDDLFDIVDFPEEDFGEIIDNDSMPTITHNARAATGSKGMSVSFKNWKDSISVQNCLLAWRWTIVSCHHF